MSRTVLTLTAAAATLLAGGLGLTACSDSDSAAAGDVAVATDGSGEWSATVDGTAIEMADASVVCAEQGDTVSLTIASTSGNQATGLSAVLGAGETPEVQAVGLGSTETGESLAYAPGVPGNEATATRDGDTYTITGTVSAVDMNNPLAGPQDKAFEMQVTCP
ncbi:lipoprotein LpqH [Corynebacterium nasicanis]|uniref:Lipoprotein LpqH n=1 Tax=Corynebacterium nasicanis TaxID=1448267 RepID=A0ABW1QER1_9CORY